MLQSPDIGKNSVESISDFQVPDQSIIKENCHNSRANNDIDIKLGTITKIDKNKTTMSKTFTMTSCPKILTSLLFFQFMTNLEQFRSWIPDAWSVNL